MLDSSAELDQLEDHKPASVALRVISVGFIGFERLQGDGRFDIGTFPEGEELTIIVRDSRRSADGPNDRRQRLLAIREHKTVGGQAGDFKEAENLVARTVEHDSGVVPTVSVDNHGYAGRVDELTRLQADQDLIALAIGDCLLQAIGHCQVELALDLDLSTAVLDHSLGELEAAHVHGSREMLRVWR